MIKLSNITLTVTENFYMSVTQNQILDSGEDIVIDFVIPDNLGYRYRFDYRNGYAKNWQYLNGMTQVTLKSPYNNGGLLWMQLVVDTETQGKQKTQELFVRIRGSVYNGCYADAVVEELEQLAFVEVQTDPNTTELVFYSLAGNEVGRVAVGGSVDLQPIYDQLETLTTNFTELQNAVQTLEQSLTELQTTVTINTDNITQLENEIDATQANIADNYYNKTEVDAKIADIDIPIVSETNNGIMTSAMLGSLNANTEDVVVVENNISELSTRVGTNETDIDTIQTDLSGVSAKANSNEVRVNGLELDVTNLQDNLAEKAPMVHSILANGDPETYGAGTLTQFGHVRLGNSLASFDNSTAASIPLVQQAITDSNTYTDDAIRATNKFIERLDDTADWVQIIQELTIYRPVPFSFNEVATEKLFGSVLTTATEGFIVRLGGFSMDLWFTSNGGQYFYTCRVINPNVQYLFRFAGENIMT